MQSKHKTLSRRQLEETLSKLRPLRETRPPRKGWIRAVRQALGMTGAQLAQRLGTNKQRVSRIEQDEVQGKLTLTTLQRAADAMDCTLVYSLIPNHSLEETVRRQAQQLARRRLARSSQMMRLEKQELSEAEQADMLQDLIKTIVEDMPRSLWDEDRHEL